MAGAIGAVAVDVPGHEPFSLGQRVRLVRLVGDTTALPDHRGPRRTALRGGRLARVPPGRAANGADCGCWCRRPWSRRCGRSGTSRCSCPNPRDNVRRFPSCVDRGSGRGARLGLQHQLRQRAAGDLVPCGSQRLRPVAAGAVRRPGRLCDAVVADGGAVSFALVAVVLIWRTQASSDFARWQPLARDDPHFPDWPGCAHRRIRHDIDHFRCRTPSLPRLAAAMAARRPLTTFLVLGFTLAVSRWPSSAGLGLPRRDPGGGLARRMRCTSRPTRSPAP